MSLRPPPSACQGVALTARLQIRRKVLLRSLEGVASLSCCVLSPMVAYACWAITMMLVTLSMLPATLLAGSGQGNDDLLAVVATVIGLLVLAALLYGLRMLLSLAVRGIFRSYYGTATRWLYHTDLLRLFVDENQTTQIVDFIEDSPGLRWISPPRPKRLEELLEFAACYFSSYRRLLYGPSRLDAGTVFLGSLAWYTGQRQCAVLGCCCAGSFYSWGLLFPVWALAAVTYINRLAVEACCIDYLLDAPRSPADAARGEVPLQTHGVGPTDHEG